MIIDHKHKFVFIHIPKCAGISIYNIFNVGLKEQGHRKIDNLCKDTHTPWEGAW